ncbi:hypothetical protein J6590_032995 [Homalodisca vitripennis]|nr:hypothetical protein J6590_032995 [Homalodisca vitripennis]
MNPDVKPKYYQTPLQTLQSGSSSTGSWGRTKETEIPNTRQRTPPRDLWSGNHDLAIPTLIGRSLDISIKGKTNLLSKTEGIYWRRLRGIYSRHLVLTVCLALFDLPVISLRELIHTSNCSPSWKKGPASRTESLEWIPKMWQERDGPVISGSVSDTIVPALSPSGRADYAYCPATYLLPHVPMIFVNEDQLNMQFCP